MFDDGDPQTNLLGGLSMDGPVDDSLVTLDVANSVTVTMSMGGTLPMGSFVALLETNGSVTLAQTNNAYALYAHDTTIGPTLTFDGAPVTAGQFGGWAPFAAEAAGSGYQVAWRFASTDQYTIWTVDGAGNYLPGNTVMSGGSLAFEAAETDFSQDLNGDGTAGIKTTVIESSGATTLSQVADTYTVGGHTLTFFGAPLAPGQLGPWAPVAAEAVADSYRVALKFGDTEQYTIWNLDSAGDFVPGNTMWSGSSLAFQSLEASLFQQDVNGDGTTGIVTTVIESSGATTLSQVADTYDVGGHTLTFFGAPLAPGQLGPWAPIAAEAMGSGYQVVLQLGATDTYTVWTLDGSAAFAPGNALWSGSNVAFQALESGVFQQDLNGDGTVGIKMTVIESAGATTLSQVADTYTVGGQTLTFFGSPLAPGQLGAWTPIGAEAVGAGYQVVLQLGATDTYTVWTLDGSGAFVPGNALWSGLSVAFQALESGVFQQDLNGDGTVGIETTVIESAGATMLTQVADTYRLGAQTLTFGGSTVVAGLFGSWTPIGAELVGGGYRVAWELLGTDHFQIWAVDASGNYLSAQATTRNGADLHFAEYVLQQDLNADGQSAVTMIEGLGATSLFRVGNNYYVTATGEAMLGPALAMGGLPVAAGQFGGWQPVGVERVADGYRVTWKLDNEQYQIWSVGGGGNFVSTQALAGSSTALQSLEGSFQQDLNGDGTIGLVPQVIESAGATALTQIGDAYFLGASGPQLMYAGTAVTPGQFPGWSPIAAEAPGASTYYVAWKRDNANEFEIWTVDGSGNYQSGHGSTLAGSSTDLRSKETLFNQDLNGDGSIGATQVIESSGTTALKRIFDNYFLGSWELTYNGTPVTADQFAGWTPIGAELSPGRIVWKHDGFDEYQIWTLTQNFANTTVGYLSQVTVSGGGYALQSLETSFAQDLNQDGRIGAETTVIESFGSISLLRIADAYGLGDQSGLSPKIIYEDSTQVVAGQTGGWVPVGAEWTTTGYQVVWKLANADQFKIWTVLSSGDYSSGDDVTMSGSTAAIVSREYGFGQDLNGDGHVPDAVVIEAFGATKLLKVGGYYVLGSNGPALGYSGLEVTDGQLDGWAPVSAERLSAGEYYVALKEASTGNYKIWVTSSLGNVTFDYGTMAGSDIVLQTAESTLQQDVNADGRIGTPDSPYDITLGYFGDNAYRLYVEAAARRWEQVITADLPTVTNATYGTIDDVRIQVTVSGIDDAGGVLGRGTALYLRNGSNLTSVGTVTIDSADVAYLAANGMLYDVVLHEIGHALGLGTTWSLFGLVSDDGYIGQYALEAYRDLSGDASATFVPVETDGSSGTAGKHWSEAVFGNELMTGFTSPGTRSPLSVMTIAALRDLGYTVDYAQADPYSLPASLVAA